jgi:hypothetical protein
VSSRPSRASTSCVRRRAASPRRSRDSGTAIGVGGEPIVVSAVEHHGRLRVDAPPAGAGGSMPPGRRSPVAGHPADRRTSSSPLNCGCGPAHGSGVLIDLDEPDVWVVEVLHDPIGVNERLSADILAHPDRPDVACRSSPVPDVAHGATNSDRTPESRPGQSGFARFGVRVAQVIRARSATVPRTQCELRFL